jgi:hypothetical protein
LFHFPVDEFTETSLWWQGLKNAPSKHVRSWLFLLVQIDQPQLQFLTDAMTLAAPLPGT